MFDLVNHINPKYTCLLSAGGNQITRILYYTHLNLTAKQILIGSSSPPYGNRGHLLADTWTSISSWMKPFHYSSSRWLAEHTWELWRGTYIFSFSFFLSDLIFIGLLVHGSFWLGTFFTRRRVSCRAVRHVVLLPFELYQRVSELYSTGFRGSGWWVWACAGEGIGIILFTDAVVGTGQCVTTQIFEIFDTIIKRAVDKGIILP